jgi:phage-related protein
MAGILTNFIFNGIRSDYMDTMNVSLDGGLQNTPFIHGQEVIEDYSSNRLLPIFYKTKKSSTTIKMVLYVENVTSDKLYDLSKWLCVKDKYSDLQFCDDLSKVYKVICISDSPFNWDGSCTQGYFEIEFHAIPYPFTMPNIIQEDFSDEIANQIIEIECKNNVTETHNMIEVEFKLVGRTDFTWKNLTTGQIMTFSNLQDGETIYINSDRKEIISSTGLYRISNFNKVFPELEYGLNNIEVSPKVEITIKTQYPFYR